MVVHGNNLKAIRQLPSESFQLIYIDPPFNTGIRQSRQIMKTVRDVNGDRIGFLGQRYTSIPGRRMGYDDSFSGYWDFLTPRLEEAWRLLSDEGSLYLHLDYREVHYAKVVLDSIFGAECFLNEIIWAYDYGARSTKKWPSKHDNILVFVKNPDAYFFNSSQVNLTDHFRPGGLDEAHISRSRAASDVWWHTIVSPMGKEKTGYPTQKPLGIVRRIIDAGSRPGDWVLDFFGGSGTTGEASRDGGRKFVLVDSSADAIATMIQRLNIDSRTADIRTVVMGAGSDEGDVL